MDVALDGLNAAQRAAVSSPASILQVLAPPGSGKTKTLTARVAYLLSHHGFLPQDIICCTFTIKASREMRERIAKLAGSQVESKLVLGTFHSICRRYLVAYGYLIGLKRGFGIADSSDSLGIIRRIVKRLNLNIQPNTARARISHQKAQAVGPEEVAAKNAQTKVLEQQEFVQVYSEYERVLAASNLLDYDDLLLRCADLLRQHPQCVSNVQAVLVDEFQDTNLIQYELMNLFAAKQKRITVVGDPDQSIYGFRSAEIKNLARMHKLYPETSVALLEDNYRSSAAILNSAQDVIEQDTARPAKSLQPTHGVGTFPVLRRLPSAKDEAAWIVCEIKRCVAMTGKLLTFSDCAVLLRSASLSREIEAAMGKAGVPYRMVGGSRFFDRVEIKLLLDYLRVVSHTGNSDALLRIINVPARRIGDETVKVLTARAEEANVTLWTLIRDIAQGRRSAGKGISRLADQGLCTLVGMIETCRQKLLECEDGATAPRMLLELIIRKLNFKEHLKTTYPNDEDNRWANVEELLSQAGDPLSASAAMENEDDDSLPAIEGLTQEQAHRGEEALAHFLANVALSTEITASEEGDGDGEQVQQGKVTISTIHAAKGLEWPVVFVPAVYEGIIPHSRAENTDEERRLLYVAMTRAQALLYLSLPLISSRNQEETSQTSFLPDQIVEARFRPTGPVLRESVIYGIADILRRDRPSQEDMVQGLDSLPSMQDDLWTADGQRNDDDDAEGPLAKRRRYEATSTDASTVRIGFSTAREHIANNPPKMEARGSNGLCDETKKAKPVGRKSANGLSQGSLSNYLCQGTFKTTKDPSSPLPRLLQAQAQAQAQPPPPHLEPGERSATSSLKRPTTGVMVPRQFSGHRLHSQAFHLSRPTLEQASDASAYTWMNPSAPLVRRSQPGAASGGIDGSVSTSTSTSTSTSASASVNVNVNVGARASASSVAGDSGNNKEIPENGRPRLRPVATYHSTSMSTLGQSGVGTGRKTLGCGRPTTTWADRMKR